MLIIFDLDDTLIKTSESIIPHKIERGGRALSYARDHIDQLLRIDAMSYSSRQAVIEFAEINDWDEERYSALLDEIRNGDLAGINIETIEEVDESLERLANEHRLCLVTRGDPEHQRKKLELSGIDYKLFEDVLVCKQDKKPEYRSLLKKFSYSPSEVMVCGDRIGYDLAPAKDLGFTTVQLARGRGKMSFDYFSEVDYKIVQLVEIFAIITEVERKNYLRNL